MSDEETIQRGRLNEVTDKAATTGAKIAADVRAGLSNVVDGVKDKISGDWSEKSAKQPAKSEIMSTIEAFRVCPTMLPA